MVHAGKIPMRPETFIKRCEENIRLGRVAPTKESYRDLVIKATPAKLLRHLRIPDSPNKKPDYRAHVDHIVPKSVWGIIMFAFLPPAKPNVPTYNVITNLAWRDPIFNMENDQSMIDLVIADAHKHPHNSAAREAWQKKWIQTFLDMKRMEGTPTPLDYVDHRELDHLMDDVGWPE